MQPTLQGGRGIHPLRFDRLLPGQGGAQQAERLSSACWALQQGILALQHTSQKLWDVLEDCTHSFIAHGASSIH